MFQINPHKDFNLSYQDLISLAYKHPDGVPMTMTNMIDVVTAGVLNQAFNLYDIGKYKEALDLLNIALQLDIWSMVMPETSSDLTSIESNPFILIPIGMCYLQMEEYGHALRTFNDVSRITDTHIEGHVGKILATVFLEKKYRSFNRRDITTIFFHA